MNHRYLVATQVAGKCRRMIASLVKKHNAHMKTALTTIDVRNEFRRTSIVVDWSQRAQITCVFDLVRRTTVPGLHSDKCATLTNYSRGKESL